MDKASNPSLETSSESRGTFLTVMAVLFVVLAFSDFTKALQYARDPAHLGLVVLGHRFGGVGKNLAFGSLVGIVLVTYAYGIWKMRAWVLPLSILYAFYVPANMVMFWSLHRMPPPPLGFTLLPLSTPLPLPRRP